MLISLSDQVTRDTVKVVKPSHFLPCPVSRKPKSRYRYYYGFMLHFVFEGYLLEEE